jgi:ATP-dependent Clp protease ATP-binding subunit ClpC
MDNPTFEYTKDARVIMLLAAQIARETGSTVITPEHILLGLLRNPDCGAMQTLRILGISLTTLRTQVEEHLPRTAALPESEEIVFSEETRAVMREAASEARSRRLTYIDTSLILLGLLLNALLPVSALLRQNGVRL